MDKAPATQSKILADRERLREKRESLAASSTKKDGAAASVAPKPTSSIPKPAVTSRLLAPTAASTSRGDTATKEAPKKVSSVGSRLSTPGTRSALTGSAIKRPSTLDSKKGSAASEENPEITVAAAEEEDEGEIARLRDEVQRLQELNSLLEEQCTSNMEAKEAEESLRLSQATERAERAEEELRRSGEEMANMQQAVTDGRVKIGLLESTLSACQEEFENAKKRITALEASHSGGAEEDPVLTSVKAALSDEQTARKAAHERAMKAEEGLTRAESEADKLRATLEDERKTSERAIATLQASLDDKIAALAKQMRELETAKSTSVTLHESVEKLKRELDQALENNATAQSAESDSQKWIDRAERAERKCDALSGEIEEVKKMRDAAENALKSAKKDADAAAETLNVQIKKLKSEKTAVDNCIHSVELRCKELEEELAEMTAKWESVSVDLEIVTEELDLAKGELDVANATLAANSSTSLSPGGEESSEVANLKAALTRLHQVTSSEKRDLEGKVASLMKAVSDLPHYKQIAKQVDELKHTIETLTSENKELKENLDLTQDSEDVILRLSEKNLALEEENKLLQERVDELDEFVTLSAEIEENYLENEKRMKSEALGREDVIVRLENKERDTVTVLKDKDRTIEQFRVTVSQLQQKIDDFSHHSLIGNRSKEEMKEQTKQLWSQNISLLTRLKQTEMRCDALAIEELNSVIATLDHDIVLSLIPRTINEARCGMAYSSISRLYFKSNTLVRNIHLHHISPFSDSDSHHSGNVGSAKQIEAIRATETSILQIISLCRRAQAVTHSAPVAPSSLSQQQIASYSEAVLNFLSKFLTDVKNIEMSIDEVLKAERREKTASTGSLAGENITHALNAFTLSVSALEKTCNSPLLAVDAPTRTWWEEVESTLRNICSNSFEAQMAIALIYQNLSIVSSASDDPDSGLKERLAAIDDSLLRLRQQNSRILHTAWELLSEHVAKGSSLLEDVASPDILSSLASIYSATVLNAAQLRDAGAHILENTESSLAELHNLLHQRTQADPSDITGVVSRSEWCVAQFGTIHATSGGTGHLAELNVSMDLGLVIPAIISAAVEKIRLTLNAAASVEGELSSLRDALKQKNLTIKEKDNEISTLIAKSDTLTQKVMALKKHETQVGWLQTRITELEESLSREKKESEEALNILQKEIQQKNKQMVLQAQTAAIPPKRGSVALSASATTADLAETNALRASLTSLRQKNKELSTSCANLKLRTLLPPLIVDESNTLIPRPPSSITPDTPLLDVSDQVHQFQRKLMHARATPQLLVSSQGTTLAVAETQSLIQNAERIKRLAESILIAPV